jgi:hypothetical protein
MGSLSVVRWFRKIRMRRRSALNRVPEERELELDVKIGIEEGVPDDEEILVRPLPLFNNVLLLYGNCVGPKTLSFAYNNDSSSIPKHTNLSFS